MKLGLVRLYRYTDENVPRKCEESDLNMVQQYDVIHFYCMMEEECGPLGLVLFLVRQANRGDRLV